MFTGIVEAIGKVRSVRDVAGARAFALEVALPAAPAVGDSVAVNGVCLTVERSDAGGFEATAVAETLARTTLVEIAAGDDVNIERAATLERALGGHLVQGYVDGVGRVVSMTHAADAAGGSTSPSPPRFTTCAWTRDRSRSTASASPSRGAATNGASRSRWCRTRWR